MLTLLAQYCLCLADSQQGTVDVLLLLLWEITKRERIKEVMNAHDRGWGARHTLTVHCKVFEVNRHR
jgi:hypothetical protein